MVNLKEGKTRNNAPYGVLTFLEGVNLWTTLNVV